MFKLENVTKYYYSSTSVTCALRKINLELYKGEFVAITGESGSGKTTLLNIISGFDTYEEGEITFNGKQTSYFDDEDWENYRKNEISFIFQNYNLIDSYTVLENVVVTYIINGYSYKEAKEKAIEKLELVGLSKDLHKKTSKLSGGQKQRLAIARALAKETDIIVADEPTGNLDDDNGKLVLELLKNLSRDKLVIVVTHNLSQIEPFITRKIRLHDGEVISDEKINNIKQNNDLSVLKNEEKEYKTILNFSFLNIKAQPIKSILLFLLTLLCSFASFIFLGNFKANLDDNKTKDLSAEIFTNFDETRLLVRRNDEKEISEDDFSKLANENIISFEKYDYITDVNYYRPTDYKYIIEGEIENPKQETTFIDQSFYVLVDHSHFMRSASSLTSDMLRSGRLPENDFEMVVYCKDDSVLNTEELVMFHNEKKMGLNIRYDYNVKIVGILKDPSNQAYFSDTLCKIMNLTQFDLDITFTMKEKKGSLYVTSSNHFKNIVVDPNIGTHDVSFGNKYADWLSKSNIQSDTNFVFSYNGKYQFGDNYNYVNSPTLTVSDSALGVSKELFDRIYEYYTVKKQFAIFIDDYTNTDQIQNYLFENGYDSISCFRASVVDYNIEKLVNRYVNLIVSVVSLFIVNIIVVVLCYTILKIKKNDYLIFKLNGLSNKLCNKINYIEVLLYTIISNILLLAVTLIVRATTTNLEIIEMFKYIKYYDYLIILSLTVISGVITSRSFAKYLAKFTKVTGLKEE